MCFYASCTFSGLEKSLSDCFNTLPSNGLLKYASDKSIKNNKLNINYYLNQVLKCLKILHFESNMVANLKICNNNFYDVLLLYTQC